MKREILFTLVRHQFLSFFCLFQDELNIRVAYNNLINGRGRTYLPHTGFDFSSVCLLAAFWSVSKWFPDPKWILASYYVDSSELCVTVLSFCQVPTTALTAGYSSFSLSCCLHGAPLSYLILFCVFMEKWKDMKDLLTGCKMEMMKWKDQWQSKIRQWVILWLCIFLAFARIFLSGVSLKDTPINYFAWPNIDERSTEHAESRRLGCKAQNLGSFENGLFNFRFLKMFWSHCQQSFTQNL